MFQVSITRPQEREFERTERLSACGVNMINPISPRVFGLILMGKCF